MDFENLPDNWTIISLEKLGIGQTKNINPSNFPDEKFELWSVPSFPSNQPEIILGKDIGSSKQGVKPNDVLLCKINPRINRVWKVENFKLYKQIASTEWIVVNADGLDSDFLVCYFRSSQFRNILCSDLSGVGGSLTRARPQIVKKIQIPLAPLNEQKRIVKKVEALSSHVRRSQEALEEVPKLIEQFRQSVLAAAFRGDLTADWRKQNPDVEPASVLLERIKNLSKIKPDSEIFERSSSFSIPDSWKWIELGKIGNFVGGGTPSKRNPDFWIGSIPWISPKDMKVNKISFGKDFISEEAVGSSSVKMIPTKSILFVVRGMILNHSFPVAITENQVTINQDMKALVPHDEVMSDYIFYFSLFMGKRILFKVKAATHGTRRLESYILENWAIPIPPIQEQLKIVDKLKDYFCKIDFLKEQLHFSHTELAVMDQSILAKAFRGELVPQDFNDEPASVLLEHIRAEQAQPKSTKKTPTTTGKQKKQTSSQLELDGMNPEIL